MKAFVKKMVLPDAPAPTKPFTGMDYFEMKHFQSLIDAPDLNTGFKPRALHRWTDDEIETLSNLWMEGKSPKQIALAMGKEIKATSNKCGYLVYKGDLPKKKTKFTQEEMQQIREEHKSGKTVPDLCRQYVTGEMMIKKIVGIKK